MKRRNGRALIPHANDRTGISYPRRLRFKGAWSGWLLHSEYDVLDLLIRMGMDNIHQHDIAGRPAREKLYRDMVSRGLIQGIPTQFQATLIGYELYQKTDRFVLSGGKWDEPRTEQQTG